MTRMGHDSPAAALIYQHSSLVADAAIADLVLTSATVEGGTSVNGTVVLATPAPPGGALVMLALPWPSSAWVLGGLIVAAAPLIGTLWTPAMAPTPRACPNSPRYFVARCTASSPTHARSERPAALQRCPGVRGNHSDARMWLEGFAHAAAADSG